MLMNWRTSIDNVEIDNENEKGMNIMSNKQRKRAGKFSIPTVAAVAVAALLVILAAEILFDSDASDKGGLEGIKNAVVKDSDLIIEVADVTDEPTFYPVEIEDTELEILAVKASDDTIRTAFNTCQVCYSSGRGYYVPKGDTLECQNCGNRFSMDDVEITRGGCNPVPITEEYKTTDDTSVTITKEFLTEAKVIFTNWKI